MSRRLQGTRRTVHSAAETADAVARMASYVAAVAADAPHCAIVGVRTRGLTLAERVRRQLPSSLGPAFGSLDITLYRDDLSTLGPQPVVGVSELPFAIDGCTVVLVDDVLYTGRTVRAAIDALLAFGRPAAIRLAVLVDRGHREYPIHADFAALRIDTERSEVVEVNLGEIDGEEGIELVSR